MLDINQLFESKLGQMVKGAIHCLDSTALPPSKKKKSKDTLADMIYGVQMSWAGIQNMTHCVANST